MQMNENTDIVSIDSVTGNRGDLSSARMSDKMDIDEVLMEESEKLEKERAEKVKEAQESVGVVTRARAEKQRKENRKDQEAHGEARARVSRIVLEIEEKYSGILSGSKMPSNQDKSVVKTWVQERNTEIEDDLEEMNKAFAKMEQKTEKLAEENERGRWLLDQTGKSEMEQIWVEWNQAKEMVKQFRELIRVTVESEGFTSLPQMVQEFKKMKEKCGEIEKTWKERKEVEEREKDKVELQMAKLESELEDARRREKQAKILTEELGRKLEEADRELVQLKKRERAEGGGESCPSCIRKDEEIDGEGKKEEQWSIEYMMKQIKEIQSIQNSSKRIQPTHTCCRSTGLSTVLPMDARPLHTDDQGDYKAGGRIGDTVDEGREKGKEKNRSRGKVKVERSDRENKENDEEKDRIKRETSSDEEGRSRRDRSSSSDSDSQDHKGKKKEKIKKYTGQLPRMKSYAGDKETWETFEEGIRVRYEGWEDRTAVIMIEEALVGEAAKVFRGIPKEVKRRGMDDVLKWLKSRLSNETPFEELENEKRLIALKEKVREKKAVEICEEIERLVNLLEENSEKREILKRRHLMLVYERASQREKLLDCWSMDDSFEKMKAKLIQMEYLEGLKGSMWNNENGRGYKYGNGGKMQNKFVDGKPACNNCGRVGHKLAECRYLKGGEVRHGGYNDGGKEGKKCTHCHKVGHLEADCYQLRPRMDRPFNPNAKSFSPPTIMQQPMRNQQTILDRSRVQKVTGKGEEEVEDREKERDNFFVIKKSREVKGEINGVQRNVILDTGAEASLIEERMLEGMKDIEILPIDKRRLLQDAQQNPIKTTGKVILEVKLEMGRKAKIGFHITKSEVGVIIGGQGLDAIGVELREIDGRKEKEKEVDEDQWEVTTSATLLKSYSIPSGEMRIVWVKGDPSNTVLLYAENEAVIEGVSMGEEMVGIPMVNITEEEMIMEKDQSIGKWRKLKREIQQETSTVKVARVQNGKEREIKEKEGEDKWWRKMIENHEEGIEEEVMEILRQNKEVFAASDEEIGRFNGYECGIELTESTPVKQKPRIVPFAIREQLRLLLEKMKLQRVIEQSSSPWSSPIVIVKKKNGSIRLCIDYRRVNQQIKLDAQPLPHLETTIQSLARRRWFTTIDLQSGFWQIGLNEEGKEITAFSCLGEHLQFRVLPFGLATSPCLFQRAMQSLLEEEMMKEGESRNVYCYIDDILIATDSKEEHLKTLNWVLRRLNEKGVKINPEKCQFMRTSVKYLGHVISKDGIQMEGEKEKAVREFKRPENCTELRSFLGLASFNRKFVRNFAQKARPLHGLSTTKDKFIWTSEHEKAFMELKEAITSAPVLVQPDFTSARSGERPFIITSDASGRGIGGVLSQMDEKGKERTIAFHSRTLRGSEKNYSIVDAEALGIYDCVQKWKGLIFGTKVIVRTDHAPLVSMFRRSNVAPRILRWATELMQFNLQIEYMKGKDNIMADALSRSPLKEKGDPVTIGEDIVINRIGQLSLEDKEETGEVKRVQTRAQKEFNNKKEVEEERKEKFEQWRVEQAKDEWVIEVKRGLQEIKEGKRDEGERVDMPRSALKLTWADLNMEEGVLYVKSRDHRNLLYVPEALREKIVKETHENMLVGHAGTTKLIKMLKREYAWGGMDKDVAEVIRGCERCKLSNAQKRFVPELVPRVANEPMEIVAIDLLDLGKGLKGARYALVVIDLYSRYAGAYPVKDKRADTVAREFHNRWVLENGRVPKALLSDNGKEFINEILEEIVRLWKIDRMTTLPYHSRANGAVERLNRTLTDIMRRMEGRPEEWESLLPYALYVYNNSPHAATGETPAFLMYHRDEKLPGGEPTRMNENYVVDKDDYKTRMQLLMKRTHQEVNLRLEKERELMKRRYDDQNRNRKVDEPKEGDRVYVRKEIRGELIPKLVVKWEGPYRILSRSTTTAEVKGIEDGKVKTVQLDRLRKVPKEEKEGKILRVGSESVIYRRLVDREDPLHWSWQCGQCGERPLGSLWKSAPEALHSIPIGCTLDLILAASVVRMEGETANKLFTEDRMQRRELHGITEDDVRQGILRGTCPHTEHCKMNGRRMTFSFSEDIPKRFHLVYAELLGEVKEKDKVFGGVLSFVELEDIIGRGKREFKSEHYEWKRVEWNNLEVEALKLKDKGVKVLLVWPRRETSYRDLEKLMEALKVISEGRIRVIITPPPMSLEDENQEAIPLMERWLELNASSGHCVKILCDSGRYNTLGLNMDLFKLVLGGKRADYEKQITAIYTGDKLLIERKKEKTLSCFLCGGGHYKRDCDKNRGSEGRENRREEDGGRRMNQGEALRKRKSEDGHSYVHKKKYTEDKEEKSEGAHSERKRGDVKKWEYKRR